MQTPVKLDHRKRHLSVPAVAGYLAKGFKQIEIALIFQITKQAVNDYIKKHHDIFAPLTDNTDTLLAINAKHIAIKAQRNLDILLDLPPEKKDQIALNAISGTHIDKYRLLSGKPTEIRANTHLIADVNELLKQLKSVA